MTVLPSNGTRRYVVYQYKNTAWSAMKTVDSLLFAGAFALSALLAYAHHSFAAGYGPTEVVP